MRNKLSWSLLALCIAAVSCMTSCKKKEVHVVMETTMGTIELKLYDATPLHRDNFKTLVSEGAYDSLLFHRVIKDFMIQGGDPDSKKAGPGMLLGEGDMPYTVPAEFRLDEGIFHRRGVLAAAREGDDVNPEQRSSAMQFYIVWGRVFDEEGLDKMQERLDQRTSGTVKLTPEMREVYKTTGGTPHLDGQYTVFGEVVSGLDVVDAIQQVATDENDRPLEDVRILRAYLKYASACNNQKAPHVEGHYTYQHGFNYDLDGNHLEVSETGTMDFFAGGAALDSARQVYTATLADGGTEKWVFDYVSPSRWRLEGEDFYFAGVKNDFSMKVIEGNPDSVLAQRIMEVVGGSIDYEYKFHLDTLTADRLKWSFTYRDGHSDTWEFDRANKE